MQLVQQHRKLLPSPNSPDLSASDNVSSRRPLPTRAQWAARRSEIEHLYIHKRWKLRHVMQHMDEVYQFIATEQMYKKRLSRWALLKNTSRASTSFTQSSTSPSKRKPAEPSLPRSPDIGTSSKPFLIFLNSIKDFSMMFYDSALSSNAELWHEFSTPAPPSRHGLSPTFNLAFDLLDRGHGELAGRVIRRGFMLLDDIFTLGGPSLIWNLLGIMHSIISRRGLQLFQMLLRYICGLATNGLPRNHPILRLLRALSTIIASILPTVTDVKHCHAALRSNHQNMSANQVLPVSDEIGIASSLQSILFVLSQAWILNAELLFSCFDPQLFPMYFTLNMHSSSIQTTAGLFEPVVRWFSGDDYGKRFDVAAKHHQAVLPTESRLKITDDTRQTQLENLHMLRADSISSLNHMSSELLLATVQHSQETARSLQTVAAMVTSKMIEMWANQDPDHSTHDAYGKMSPRVADHVACIMKALIPSRQTSKTAGTMVQAHMIEQRRRIVALLEYAYGEVDPEVTGELWLLKDALVDAGRLHEAQAVEGIVMERLDEVCRSLSIL